MKKLPYIFLLVSLCMLFTQCADYLETSSPANSDDTFVTSSASETFKILSSAYANYRQGSVMGTYNWNDPISSDMEYYPEAGSSNNSNAKMNPSIMTVDFAKGGFNSLYSVITYAGKAANLVAAKDEYLEAKAAGKTNDWTQLYGEAVALRSLCYFDLTRHFGDVPYGYENQYVDTFNLSSRYDIYTKILAQLEEAEPLMYKIGEGGITSERLSRTFVDALIGKIYLTAGGYQTLRTDVAGLYGSMTFEVKAEDAANECQYARPTNYKEYLNKAVTYLGKAYKDNAGTAQLVTSDEFGNNTPFQAHFQYGMNLTVSPEDIFTIGTAQGPSGTGQAMNGEYGYAFGRGSSGGNNTAPNKLFAAVRMNPAFYYGAYANDDPRRDVSGVVTGFDGKGNEKVIPFKPNSKADGGGICLNKWDLCRMQPVYIGKQRMAGINWPICRMGEVVLMLAEANAVLGQTQEALGYVNTIRERAFGDSQHKISATDDIINTVIEEAQFELFGEGQIRWFLIRTGKMAENIYKAAQTYKDMAAAILGNDGYYQFANGNQFPAYIWTKQVPGAVLTARCADENDPVLFPGWRGVYDFSTTTAAVTGTDHNTAIKGLFKFIPEDSAEAPALIADGYAKFDYGKVFADNLSTYLDNMGSGITSANDVPKYFFPIPSETISQSKGSVTNGYGLPDE